MQSTPDCPESLSGESAAPPSPRRPRPVSVLLVSDAPSVGGAETYLLTLARRLDRRRFRPALAISTAPEAAPLLDAGRALGLPVHRLPHVPRLSELRPVFRNAAFFAVHRFRLIHFNLVDARSCGGPAVLAWFTGHRRLMATEQLPGGPPVPPPPFRERFAALRFRRVIALSAAGAAAAGARGVPREVIRVIPNGIDPPDLPDASVRAALRAALDVPPGAPAVGIIGALRPQKGHDLFLHTAALLARRHPEARFLVAGDGPDAHALRELARSLGLDGRVRFLGHVPRIADVLASLDVVVSCSTYEGVPFALLEAMGYGRAVVAPDIPGMREILEDGVSGLVRPRRAGDMAGAVSDLVASPRRAAALGVAARQAVLHRFSAEAMVRATERVYDEVLGRPADIAPP